MKLNDGRISILIDREKTVIELRDDDSSTMIARVELTPEQFSSAMSRLAYTECSIEVFPEKYDRVGKVMEHKTFEFKMPVKKFGYDKETAKDIIKTLCPKGWIPELSFSSQGSFFMKDEKWWARTIIRRWVKK